LAGPSADGLRRTAELELPALPDAEVLTPSWVLL